MGILLTANNLGKSFDSRVLFEDLNFVIESRERVGLIGPNGAGKSSLLKMFCSQLEPDEGEVVLQKGTRISFVEQVPHFKNNATVLSSLLEGAKDPDDWQASIKADELLWQLELEKAGIKTDTPVESLSGGWQKRLALAKALMSEPNLLLMDEPTNHLDIESIMWLENLIRTAPFATVTITHDRLFLQRVSNRILELDRRNKGGILSVQGNYTTYLELKEHLMSAQEKQQTTLKGVLRRETQWLKAGVKARSTKQQARIKRHGELTEDFSELKQRNIKRVVSMEFQGAENNPKRLIDAKKISKSYEEGVYLFKDLDLLFTPGRRVGVLGPNGCGKSTLIRILLGLEAQDSGNVFSSELLKPVYFEQNRDSLDPNLSILRTLCPSGDHVRYRGRQLHIRSYLEKFLFSQSQMDKPIRSLSGGEQSRILIAKLMLREANLLILDEPTNDLDIPTLNVLQECLTQFEGAVLLVSHDRFFLDQISNQILAFPILDEEKALGKLHFFTDVAQWEEWHDNELAQRATQNNSSLKSQKIKKSVPQNIKKEQEALTKKIEKAEAAMAKLGTECELPEVMADTEKVIEIGNKMTKLQTDIDDLYAKWESLESCIE